MLAYIRLQHHGAIFEREVVCLSRSVSVVNLDGVTFTLGFVMFAPNTPRKINLQKPKVHGT
jgi:hypothetical protein